MLTRNKPKTVAFQYSRKIFWLFVISYVHICRLTG